MGLGRWAIVWLCAAGLVLAAATPARAGYLLDGTVDVSTVPNPQEPVEPPAGAVSSILTTYFDGTFTPADWSTATFQAINAAGIFVSENQSLTGGNPDAYFQFQGGMSSFPGQTSYLRQAHFSSKTVFNPAVSGPITGITAGFSQGSFTFNNGVIFETGLIIRQGGTLYWPNINWAYGLQGAVGWYGSYPMYYPSSTSLPSQWSEVGGSGHPNFTAAGAPIEFGFWTGYYFWNGAGTVTDGVDNWKVEINSTAVPEPTTLLPLGGGVVVVTLLRRRGRAI